MTTSPTINPNLVSTEAKYALGTVGYDHLGKEYLYARADGAVAAKAAVRFEYTTTETFEANASASGEAAMAVAPVAFADNEYGWFQTKGLVENMAATGVSANDLLSLLVDANLRFQAVPAVDESGSATLASGILTVRAVAMENHTSNVADVLLL